MESCLGLALPIGKVFPAECQSPAGRRAGAAVLTFPFPVTESLKQKRHRFKLKNHPNRDLQRKVSGNYEGFGSYPLMLKSELLGQQAQKIGIASIIVLKWSLKEKQE